MTRYSRQKSPPKKCPHPNPQNYLTWQKGRCRCEFSYTSGDGRFSWVIQVGPLDSQGNYTGRERDERVRVRGRDARTEAEVKVRQGHQSRNAGHLQKPATPRKRVLPRTSRRNASTVVWTSDLQTWREQTRVALGRKFAVTCYRSHRTLIQQIQPAGNKGCLCPRQADTYCSLDTPASRRPGPASPKLSPAATALPQAYNPDTPAREPLRKCF